MSTPRITIIQGKGGVGKSTLAVNMAGELAAAGQRVLLWELDAQGNVRLDLGIYGTDLDDDGAAMVVGLMMGTPPEPVRVRNNLDFVMGGRKLKDFAFTPASRSRIRQVLEQVDGRYDFIILDAAPGAGELRMATLMAATHLVMPVQPDAASNMGLGEVAVDLGEVRAAGHEPTMVGCVGTFLKRGDARIERGLRFDTEEMLGEVAPYLGALPQSKSIQGLTRRHGKLWRELLEWRITSPATFKAAEEARERHVQGLAEDARVSIAVPSVEQMDRYVAAMQQVTTAVISRCA